MGARRYGVRQWRSLALAALGVTLAALLAGCGVTTTVGSTGAGRDTTPGVATATATAAARQPVVSAGSHGTLVAKVEAGPTCPVEQAENPCPPKPVADRQVTIETPAGAVVMTAMTDAQGRFSVALPPGTYVVRVEAVPGQMGLRQVSDGKVTVTEGQTATVTIEVDTGIR
jgi:hypothetical protein